MHELLNTSFIVHNDTLNIPPPKSNIDTFLCDDAEHESLFISLFFVSKPEVIIRNTFNPAIFSASLVLVLIIHLDNYCARIKYIHTFSLFPFVLLLQLEVVHLQLLLMKILQKQKY